MKHCQWCDDEFTSIITYQIYCSVECRDLATKEKIAARYLITRRQKRQGRSRSCNGCGEGLSIYNDEDLCIKCIIDPKDVKKVIKDLKGLANDKK